MKVIALCFECKEPHDITAHRFGVEILCEKCGGSVVTKSGHASIRVEE